MANQYQFDNGQGAVLVNFDCVTFIEVADPTPGAPAMTRITGGGKSIVVNESVGNVIKIAKGERKGSE